MARGRQTLFDILGTSGSEKPAVDRRAAKASKKTRQRAPAARRPGEGELLVPLGRLVLFGVLSVVAGGLIGYSLGRPSSPTPDLDTSPSGKQYSVKVWTSPDLSLNATEEERKRVQNLGWEEVEHIKGLREFKDQRVMLYEVSRGKNFAVLVGKNSSHARVRRLLQQLKKTKGRGGERYSEAHILETPR